MNFSVVRSILTVLLIARRLTMTVSKSVAQSDTIDLSRYGSRLFGAPSKDVGLKVASWYENPNGGNPEELGSYVEGDILITGGQSRNGLIAETTHWPNAQIPFEIVGDFDAHQMDLLEKAILTYHNNTCIKFVPRLSEVDYISIQSGGSGCWSSVGRVGGRQIVNLQKNGCLSAIGTVIHELMHACGFTHEQNREERDEYVTIRLENIKAGTEHNFEKAEAGTTSGFGSTYDYGSVMHYSANAFSVNGKPTIESKKKIDEKMGQRDGFSKKDIEKLNKMYNCKATTASTGYKPQVSITDGIIELINLFYSLNDTYSTPKKSINKKSMR